MADIKQISVDGTTMDLNVPDGKITADQLNEAFLDDIQFVEGYASNPTARGVGQMYFNTTLGKPLFWNGTVWVDANGNSV